ncbi:MAG: M15 family metallopeptidase [Patescibacteria group bacterium]
MLRFFQAEKRIGARLYRKLINEKKNPKAPLMSFDDLYSFLDRREKNLIDKICLVRPKEYGKNFTIFYGIKPAPKDLVLIEKQEYFSAKDKKIKKVKTQYLPKSAFVAFIKMKKVMRKELETAINVISGYRSPAYQAAILFIVLFENRWNVKNTLRRLTLPGCSEHGYPLRQGMDVAPEKGIENLEDFDQSDEYKWLLKNAKKFGFSLSYPKGNKYGVMFEPWHWHYVEKK